MDQEEWGSEKNMLTSLTFLFTNFLNVSNVPRDFKSKLGINHLSCCCKMSSMREP